MGMRFYLTTVWSGKPEAWKAEAGDWSTSHYVSLKETTDSGDHKAEVCEGSNICGIGYYRMPSLALIAFLLSSKYSTNSSQ